MYKVLFLTFLFSYTTLPELRAQSDLQEIIDHAKRASAENRLKDAFEWYSQCRLADTTHLACLEGLANTAQKMGMYKEAKEANHRLEKDTSYNIGAWRRLSAIYEQENNLPRASKYYHLLAAADSTNAYYLRKLGQVYQGAGLINEAFTYYAKAYAYHQRDVHTIKGLAEIFINNAQYEESDSILLNALAYDSANVQLNLLYARSLYRRKNYSATADILEPLSNSVGLQNFYSKMLGYAYLQIDSIDRSIFHLFRSLTNESDPEYAEYYLAVAHERKDDLISAKHFYERALQSGISDRVPVYHKQLGILSRDSGDLKEAIRHFESSLGFSDNPALIFELARLCDEYYKDKTVAIRYYKRYLRAADTDEEYREYAASRSRFLQNQLHMSR